MALEREQVEIEELPPSIHAPLSTPTTPPPDTIEPTTGKIPTLPPRKRRVPLRLWLPAVLLLILAVLGAAVYAVDAIWLVARATITVVPATSTMNQSVPIDAVLVSPTASQAKVTAYTASSKRESATHAISGVGHQPALAGRGTLTFYNLATYQIVIPAGMTFTGSDGVQIATDAAIVVPAGNPPALGSAFGQAHAVTPGASGNIGALDVNSALSGSYNGIEVKNPAAFSGGQDAQTYPVVSQADIKAAAAPLVTSLTQAAQSALQAKLGPSEQFLTQASCTSTVQANPAVGQAGETVIVAVQVTCRRDAYDQQQVTRLATARFTDQAAAQLGAAYAPVGSPTTATIRVTVVDAGKGQFTLIVPVTGRFVYQFNQTTLQRLPGLLAGKSSNAASSLLLNTPGIAQASIQLTGWNNGALPTDATRIRVIIAAPRSA